MSVPCSITGGQRTECNAKERKPCFLLSPSVEQLLNYAALGVCLTCKLDRTSVGGGRSFQWNAPDRKELWKKGFQNLHFSVPHLPRLGDHSLVTRKGNGGVACSGLSTLLSQGGMDEKRC